MVKVTLIAAVDSHLGFGNKGAMPWPRVEADLANFRAITSGHIIIMGRLTFESLGCTPLHKRLNVVVSSTFDATLYDASSSVKIVRSLQEALDYVESKGYEDAFVIGGVGLIEQAAYSIADRLLLTCIIGTYTCDTYFPSGVLDLFYTHSSKKLTVEDSSIATFYLEMYKGSVTTHRKGSIENDIKDSCGEFCLLIWDVVCESLKKFGFNDYADNKFEHDLGGDKGEFKLALSDFHVCKMDSGDMWLLQVKILIEMRTNEHDTVGLRSCVMYEYHKLDIENPVLSIINILNCIIKSIIIKCETLDELLRPCIGIRNNEELDLLCTRLDILDTNYSSTKVLESKASIQYYDFYEKLGDKYV